MWRLFVGAGAFVVDVLQSSDARHLDCANQPEVEATCHLLAMTAWVELDTRKLCRVAAFRQ